MIGIVGADCQIARDFIAMTGEPWRGMRLEKPDPSCDRYLICAGLLLGRALRSLAPDRVAQTFLTNFADIAVFCDVLFDSREDARVVVVGSESGFSGSYDMAYAGSKAALHLYVETKRLRPSQQLAAIAPGIISDGGMTTRRTDTAALEQRMRDHPKRRFVSSHEVAALAAFLLGADGSYISGTTVRMNGGERR